MTGIYWLISFHSFLLLLLSAIFFWRKILQRKKIAEAKIATTWCFRLFFLSERKFGLNYCQQKVFPLISHTLHHKQEEILEYFRQKWRFLMCSDYIFHLALSIFGFVIYNQFLIPNQQPTSLFYNISVQSW